MNRGNPKSGFNPKTGATPSYKPSQPKRNDNAQAEAWLKRPQEPFASSQPSSNPRIGYGKGTGHMDPMGGVKGRAPHSQSEINKATGNPDRPYKGLNPINSGRVTTQAPKKNTDNGAQAQAKAQGQARFNRDFEAAYKELKHWGGLS